MISLEEGRKGIKRIIEAASRSFNVEIAVFDKECNLIECTREYFNKKGGSVHIPSLIEVINKGKVLVSNPGHMDSCVGCRFYKNCPSTVEILNSIKCNDSIIGVVSITSFTRSGQDRLLQNLDIYTDVLNDTSYLISSAASAYEKNQKISVKNIDSMVQLIMDLSSNSFFYIDEAGVVTYCNPSALKLFPQCMTYRKSIGSIFPSRIVQEILGGHYISNRHIKCEVLSGHITSLPIFNNDAFKGAIVTLSQDLHSKTNKVVIEEKRDFLLLDDIKGNSIEIQKLKSLIVKIANSPSTVLISGETGTGKELFARVIHNSSNRANMPFISINCASIPENLFESELFGYDEGAFTGARKGGKPGKFELAHGGTLLLDEIGDMPMCMQAKLLRVLQEHTFERVGGTRSIHVDVRIIAATNKNLEQLVQQRKFREDLFYRLSVIPITIPSLRQRQADIDVLSRHFLNKYNKILKKDIREISYEVMEIFKSHNWPGNIRELENVIEYAVNIEDGEIISTYSLPEGLKKQKYDKAEIKSVLKDAEVEAIKTALDKHGWDVDGKTKAAEELGIGLRTLYRKIKDLELKNK